MLWEQEKWLQREVPGESQSSTPREVRAAHTTRAWGGRVSEHTT